jgi:hypothetical protein
MKPLGKELVGKTFNRLTVISQLENKAGKTRFSCLCDCGKEIEAVGSEIQRGHTRSCGCLRRDADMGRATRLTYGLASFHSLVSIYRRNAKKRGISFELTDEECFQLFTSDCHYCGSPPKNTRMQHDCYGEFTYSGIDRIDNTKGYVLGNIAPCCTICNIAKGRQTLEEFKLWIQQTYRHLFSEGNQ